MFVDLKQGRPDPHSTLIAFPILCVLSDVDVEAVDIYVVITTVSQPLLCLVRRGDYSARLEGREVPIGEEGYTRSTPLHIVIKQPIAELEPLISMSSRRSVLQKDIRRSADNGLGFLKQRGY